MTHKEHRGGIEHKAWKIYSKIVQELTASFTLEELKNAKRNIQECLAEDSARESVDSPEDGSYQWRLIKLTSSHPQPGRSISIPHPHDPRRLKPIREEGSETASRSPSSVPPDISSLINTDFDRVTDIEHCGKKRNEESSEESIQKDQSDEALNEEIKSNRRQCTKNQNDVDEPNEEENSTDINVKQDSTDLTSTNNFRTFIKRVRKPADREDENLCNSPNSPNKIDVSFFEGESRSKSNSKDGRKRSVTENVVKQNNKCIEKSSKKIMSKSIEEKEDKTSEKNVTDRENTNANATSKMHLFDSVLAQLDEVFYAKAQKTSSQEKCKTSKKCPNVNRKDSKAKDNKTVCLVPENTSSNEERVSTNIKLKDDLEIKSVTQVPELDNDKDKTTCNPKENNNLVQTVPELLAEQVGSNLTRALVPKKGNSIKLNLNNHIQPSEGDTSENNQTKTDENLDPNVPSNNVRDTNLEKESNTDIDECSVEINHKTVQNTSTDTATMTILFDEQQCNANNEENTEKERSHESVISESEQTNKLHEIVPFDSTQRKRKMDVINETLVTKQKKSKHIRKRFREYFGDDTTVSEDEQEQMILKNTYKKRRKKDSIKSCDSGIYANEENCMSNGCLEIVKEIQKAVPDSTMEGCDSNVCKDASLDTEVEILMETKTITNDKTTIKTEVKPIEETIEVENNELTEVKCETNSIPSVGDTEILDITNECNSVESTTYVTEICEIIQRSDANSTSMASTALITASDVVEKSTDDGKVYDTEVEVSSNDQIPEILFEQFPTLEDTDNVDSKEDLMKLLHTTLDGTYQTVTDGNVLSIRSNFESNANENIVDEHVDQVTELQNLVDEVLNSSHTGENKEKIDAATEQSTVTSKIVNVDAFVEDVLSASQNDAEITSVENCVFTVSDQNENVISESSNMKGTTEKDQNIRASTVSHPRLRVLSSAELGSRWCPTPVNTDVSFPPNYSSSAGMTTTDRVFDTSLNSDGQSLAVQPPRNLLPSSSVPSQNCAQTGESGRRPTLDPKLHTEVLRKSIHKIWKFVTNIRFINAHYTTHISGNANVQTGFKEYLEDAYDNAAQLLLGEIECIGMITNDQKYDSVVHRVIRVLNNYLMKDEPLLYGEMISYIPVHRSSFYSVNPSNAEAHANKNSNTNHKSKSTSNINDNNRNNNNHISIQSTPYSVVCEQPGSKAPPTAVHPSKWQTTVIPKNTSSNVSSKPHIYHKPRIVQNVLLSTQDLQRLNQTNKNVSTNSGNSMQNGRGTIPVPQMTHFKAQPQRPSRNIQNVQHTIKQNVHQKIPYIKQTSQNVVPDSNMHTGFLGSTQITQNVDIPQRVAPQYVTSALTIANTSMHHLTNNSVLTTPFPNPTLYGGYAPQQINQNLYMNLPVLNTPQLNTTGYVNTSYHVNTYNPDLHGMRQQPNRNVTHERIQVQNMRPLQFQQNVHQPTSGMGLSRNVFEAPPNVNYMQDTQCTSNVAPELMPNNVPQNILPKLLQNTPMHNPKSSTIQGTTASQDSKQTGHPFRNTQQTVLLAQIGGSGESAVKTTVQVKKKQAPKFDIINCLSVLQKLMLLKQISDYFLNRTYLQPYMTLQQQQAMQLGDTRLNQLQIVLSSEIQNDIGRYTQHETETTTGVEERIENGVKIKLQKPINERSKKSLELNAKELPVTVQEKNRVVDKSSVKLSEQLGIVQGPIENLYQLVEKVPNQQDSDISQTQLVQKDKENVEVLESGVKNISQKETLLSPKNNPLSETREIQQNVPQEQVHVPNVEEDKEKEGQKKPEVSEKAETTSDNDNTSKAAIMEQKDTVKLLQPKTGIVTVEIVPNKNEVIVIDTDMVPKGREGTPTNDENKVEECEKSANDDTCPNSSLLLPIVKYVIPEVSVMTLDKASNNTNHETFNDVNEVNKTESFDTESVSRANSPTEYVQIADVRSIPLDLFEKMEDNCTSDSNDLLQLSEKVENELPLTYDAKCQVEEKVKACLHCNKISTVVCERCLVAQYCSKRCSELHWSNHYEDCNPCDSYAMPDFDSGINKNSETPNPAE